MHFWFEILVNTAKLLLHAKLANKWREKNLYGPHGMDDVVPHTTYHLGGTHKQDFLEWRVTLDDRQMFYGTYDEQ